MNLLLLVLISVCIITIIILLFKIHNLSQMKNKENTDTNLLSLNINDLKKENQKLKSKIQTLKITTHMMKKRIYRLSANQTDLSKIKLKGKYILYADYDEERIETAKKVLTNIGVKFKIIRDVKKVIEIMQTKNNYDAVIVNNISQGIDSETIITKLHDNEDFDTPIIVASGCDALRKHFIYEVGADEFIKKPLEEEETKKALENAFYYKSIINKI